VPTARNPKEDPDRHDPGRGNDDGDEATMRSHPGQEVDVVVSGHGAGDDEEDVAEEELLGVTSEKRYPVRGVVVDADDHELQDPGNHQKGSVVATRLPHQPEDDGNQQVDLHRDEQEVEVVPGGAGQDVDDEPAGERPERGGGVVVDVLGDEVDDRPDHVGNSD
jgi:hypothetical protein